MEYRKLPHGNEMIGTPAVKADACLKCGHCDKRCPFKVNRQSKMKVAEYFGKGV